MDEKTRNAVALKKFSIIEPVLNGQVSNNVEYFRKVASQPIEMPHYGMRNYSYKTIESWLCDYNKRELEGLARGARCDKGKSRKISPELGEAILTRKKANARLPITLLYEHLEYICASLGCTLLHSQPFVPQGRGKVERMF